MKTTLLFAFLGLCTLALGQAEAAFLDRNYEFQDGLYLSLASFQADSPDISINDLEGRLVTNDDTGLTKSDYLAMKSDTGAQEIDLQNVWGIALDGHPYIRISENTGDRQFATFAKVRVRGAICYFTFDSEVERYIEVKAYNPLNGKPFRRGRVKNMETVNNKRILRFDTGEVAPLTRENLLAWVQDDPQLTEAVTALEGEDISEKLYRSMLIYDDRHPVFITRKD
ncbi:hypothetical protein [Flavilitoribacter nigricans]|uniref:Uncharacterized protein n=1 Tax=Flavilitoribacter nigricans (strain ATCC 23147 / DSM 23189 / NBRC 102662 / NCIMB 1420 / SS-2) TaxID=1122177 RepID=A0A2D0NIV2_FLAN2|nr:hypothetical protein [Flavilitoribacter nigricans]PHN08422.1 hypothetical protein CRP01_00480 [Flavilitoribacter nigricans DSM 23189 = NBRC 102662]